MKFFPQLLILIIAISCIQATADTIDKMPDWVLFSGILTIAVLAFTGYKIINRKGKQRHNFGSGLERIKP